MSEISVLWILGVVFAAGGILATQRLALNKAVKDLNIVGGNVRRLEAARLDDLIEYTLALYKAAPEDKRDGVLDLLRHRRRA